MRKHFKLYKIFKAEKILDEYKEETIKLLPVKESSIAIFTSFGQANRGSSKRIIETNSIRAKNVGKIGVTTDFGLKEGLIVRVDDTHYEIVHITRGHKLTLYFSEVEV